MSFNYPQAQNALSLQGNTVASTTPTAGQVLVWSGSQWQPGSGSSGGNYNVVYSSDYNWSLNYQPGWGALTAGVPATLTLATCPVGVDTSASTILGGPQGAYSIYIFGSDGIAEVVKVTGGTCTPGMTNGTIQFIPANNHTVSGGSPPTGYTLSSATAGIQEAINTACGTSQTYYNNSNCKVVIPPSGELSGMNGYNIYDTIYFHSNQSILSGYGATLNHYGRGPCLQLGNLLSSNSYVSNRIEGLMFRAPVYQTATGTLNTNGTAVVTAAGISKFGTNWASGSNILINGTAYTIAFVNSNTQITLTTTISTASGLSYAYQAYSGSLITSTQRTNGITTITTSEPHGFVTGDRVTQMLTDNAAFWGDVPYITVTSPTTYTYWRWQNGNSARNITATSITSNVLTITANNSFTVGENVLLVGTSENYLNNQVVTVASLLGASGSPPTYTGFTANFTATNYSNPSEPSTAEAYPPVGNIALQTTPGVVALTYVAILDNAGGSQLIDISSANAYQEYYFNHFFDLWDDECCTIKSFNNNAGSLQNNVNWTGSFIWSGGASGLPLAANQLAPVITLKDSNITANYSNGVTVYNSNGVYIHDTVLQATGPWQVYTSNATGNYQGAHLENLYSESSANSNPASPVRSPYAGCGIAGAIFGPSTGAASFRIKGTGVEGQLPTVGVGATSYLYYVVINDTTTGTSSAPLPVMIANSNGGAVTVSWPRVSNGTDVITYDVLRVSPNTLGSVSNIGPYTGGCPGGAIQSPPNVSTMGSVVTGQAQQSGFIQTFVDNTTVPTSNYPTVPIGNYQGNILFWPAQAITVGITPVISDNIVNVFGTGACGSPTNVCLYPGYGTGAAPAISASTATSFALNNLYEQQALILNDGWYQGPQTANLKGRLQFASSGLAFPGEVNNGHIITLVDSDPQLTRAYALNRPPNSSSDCFIGVDGTGPYYANVVPIAIGSPVSISHYIANIGDGTNWKERLTSTVKQFKVPVQLESVTFATLPSSPANGMEVYCSDCTFGSNPCTGSGSGSFAYRVNGAWVCSDSSGSGGVNATNSPSQYAVTTWVNSTTIEGIVPSSTSGYPLLSNGSSAYASFGQLSVGAISATGTPSSTTYLRGDGSWATVSGSGSVTSVAMTVPAWLSVSGSPITSAGTLAITSAGSLTQNWVLATPNGSSGVLAPRALVAGDIPSLAYLPTSTALPANTASVSHEWFASYNSTTGAFTQTQPAASDLSNGVQGSGAVVLATSPTITSPTFTTPVLGTPASGTLTNCTFPTLNQNTTGTSGGLTGTPSISITNLTISGTLTDSASSTGSANQVLTVNSSGGKPIWANATGGFSNPMTTLGDVIYENATPAPARLAGNTSATKNFLVQTGNGTISAAPAWGTIASGDIPNNTANTTGTSGGLTGTPSITVATITATTISGGALSGTFTGAPTMSGNIAFTGTPTFSNTLALNTTGTAGGLTGTPALPNGTTATTQTAGDNSTKLATTAYVATAVAAVSGGGVSTVSFSATPIFNATGYSGFKITLTGNVTSSTFTNGTAGSLYTFEITQDGTGGRTFVWPTNFKGGASVTDQAAGANETIAQLFYFDGSNALAVGPGMVTP